MNSGRFGIANRGGIRLKPETQDVCKDCKDQTVCEKSTKNRARGTVVACHRLRK